MKGEEPTCHPVEVGEGRSPLNSGVETCPSSLIAGKETTNRTGNQPLPQHNTNSTPRWLDTALHNIWSPNLLAILHFTFLVSSSNCLTSELTQAMQELLTSVCVKCCQ